MGDVGERRTVRLRLRHPQRRTKIIYATVVPLVAVAQWLFDSPWATFRMLALVGLGAWACPPSLRPKVEAIPRITWTQYVWRRRVAVAALGYYVFLIVSISPPVRWISLVVAVPLFLPVGFLLWRWLGWRGAVVKPELPPQPMFDLRRTD